MILNFLDPLLQNEIDRILYGGLPVTVALGRLAIFIQSHEFNSEERYGLLTHWEMFILQNRLSIDICWTSTQQVNMLLDEWEDTWLKLIQDGMLHIYLGDNQIVKSAFELMRE